MKRIVFWAIILLTIISCKEPAIVLEMNPAAEGFRFSESDSFAINLADSVMLAMGGRENWDATRYLKWNFFGSRRHVWDKWTNDLIIEGIRDSFYIEMNLDSLTGTVNLKGNQLSKSDSLDKYLQKGKDMWINDAYWVFLPFKLKDSGLALKYIGQDTTEQGALSEVIELRFKEVGKTPNNKYRVHVHPSEYMITQWDFYTNAEDTLARFKTPWEEYRTYDRIQLSSSRGENYLIDELSASDTLSNYFTVR